MVHILSKKIEREAKSINGRQVEWKKWLLKRQPIPVKPTSVQKWVLLLIQGDELIKWYAGRKHFHQCRSERWSRLGEKWLIFLGSWLSMEILFASCKGKCGKACKEMNMNKILWCLVNFFLVFFFFWCLVNLANDKWAKMYKEIFHCVVNLTKEYHSFEGTAILGWGMIPNPGCWRGLQDLERRVRHLCRTPWYGQSCWWSWHTRDDRLSIKWHLWCACNGGWLTSG